MQIDLRGDAVLNRFCDRLLLLQLCVTRNVGMTACSAHYTLNKGLHSFSLTHNVAQ